LREIGRDEAREQVLACVLIAAAPGESLLVAVIDHRHPAQRKEHRVRQYYAPQRLLIADARAEPADEIREAPAVVVADEGRQLLCRLCSAFVEDVALEEPRQHVGT